MSITNFGIYKLSNDITSKIWHQTATTSTHPQSWYSSFKGHPSSIFNLKILSLLRC